MKKIIALLAICALVFLPVAFATDSYDNVCSPNGCSQGTLVRALYNLQVGLNDVITNTLNGAAVAELKVDHDADNDEFALAVTELTELKVDHDALNNTLDTYKNVINILLATGAVQTNGLLLSDPVLGVGATAGKANASQNTIAYFITGQSQNVPFVNDFCDATGLTDIVNDYEKVLFSVAAAGTCTVTQGVGAVSQIAAVYPAVPAGEVVIGGLEIGDGGAHDYNVATLAADGGTFISAAIAATAIVARPVAVTSIAADLTAANPTGFAANLAAAVATGTVVGATSYGTGTAADPLVKITD